MLVIVRRNGTPTRGYGFKTSPTSIASLMGISLLCVSYTSLTHSRFHFTLVFFCLALKLTRIVDMTAGWVGILIQLTERNKLFVLHQTFIEIVYNYR